MNKHRETILGVPVDAYLKSELLSDIEKGIQSPGTKNIFAVNAEKIMRAPKDPELFSALKDARFLIPDGYGAVVGLKMLHKRKVSRITGVQLMDILLELAAEKGYKVFLFGSEPEVNMIASERIQERLPSLNLVGTQHGYLPQEEYRDMVKRINELGTEILFVALGSPRQEKWIHAHKKYLNVKICMGVGGSLDVIAGKVPRAPVIFQKLGLEWLFRLLREPSRVKRQLVIPRFVFALIKERLTS
jgi:N-acetylglucosaminyldiphosphoundecaprenol N-acetyl-beta-D-mannosaminyltransferase